MNYPFRKVDWGVLLSVLLIIGAIYAGFNKPLEWDQNTRDISEMKPKLEQTEKDLTELRAINTTQMTLIIRELDGIHKEMKRDRG